MCQQKRRWDKQNQTTAIKKKTQTENQLHQHTCITIKIAKIFCSVDNTFKNKTVTEFKKKRKKKKKGGQWNVEDVKRNNVQ